MVDNPEPRLIPEGPEDEEMAMIALTPTMRVDALADMRVTVTTLLPALVLMILNVPCPPVLLIVRTRFPTDPSIPRLFWEPVKMGGESESALVKVKVTADHLEAVAARCAIDRYIGGIGCRRQLQRLSG